MRIIPAIDLQAGKCVRLFKGDFAKTTEYSDDPVAVSREFSALDVRDLHIVDLDGARLGQQRNRAIVQAIAQASGLAIQLGGGIRKRETVKAWLDSGVERCVIGSMAITETPTVSDWLREFGPDRLVLALDVRLNSDGEPMLTTHGWTRQAGISLWECLDEYADAAIRHVLCTDVGRDGAMLGPNIELYEEAMRRYPGLCLQASGGVRNLEDLRQLKSRGIPAAISGRALLDGAITVQEIREFRRGA